MTTLACTLDPAEVKEMVRGHIELQLGCYFSETQPVRSGLLATSKWIDDFYWNSCSSFSESSPEEFIEAVHEAMAAKGRKPAFYVDPTCEPAGITTMLEQRSYSVEREVWMCSGGSVDEGPSSDIEIVDADAALAEDFLHVFSVAFGGEATEADGYGDIPSEYLSALRDSLSGVTAGPSVRHVHFLARLEGQVVGCGSVHVNPKFAGLYNVGVLPAYRRRGIGGALSRRAFSIAGDSGVQRTFLQTQPGGSVQAFYEGLGCRVVFEAAIVHKS